MSEVLEKWPELLQGSRPTKSPYRALLDGRIYRVRRGDPAWGPNIKGIKGLRDRCGYWAARLDVRVSIRSESADSVIIQAFPRTQAPK